jgi:hypothetical protein
VVIFSIALKWLEGDGRYNGAEPNDLQALIEAYKAHEKWVIELLKGA